MRRFNNLVAFLLFLTCHSLHAQEIMLVGQKTFGGSEREWAYDAAFNESGELVIVGLSASGISGDITEENRGEGDFLILSLDGQLIETGHRLFGGTGSDAARRMIVLEDGGIVVGGSSASPISEDKTAPNKGGLDYWVVRFDSDGNELWQRTFGGSQNDILSDMTLMDDGNLLLAGTSYSGISGDKTEASRGSTDYWLVCVGPDGDMIWDRTYGGSGIDNMASVVAIPDGSILVSGESVSQTSGEKTQDNYGIINLWMLLLDSEGNVTWDLTVGGSDNEAVGIATYLNNAIYVAASSNSPVSGTKTQTPRGLLDYWVSKIGMDGTVIWDRAFGGTLGEGPRAIAPISGNRIILSGFSASNATGEKSEPSNGMSDMWLVCIDEDGDMVWDKGIGGSQDDLAYRTVELAAGHLFTIGYSNSGISGDKTESNRGQEDFWIVEIVTPVGIAETEPLELHMAPNPAFEEVQVSLPQGSAPHLLTITDMQGRQVLSQQVMHGRSAVATGDLPAGLYTVTVADEHGRAVSQRMVKLNR